MVTGAIAEITETGVRMENGQDIPADVLITATGFNVLLFGGARFSLDGAPVDLTEKVAYRGVMLSDMPNFAFAIGYTNASWTLKIGLLVDWFSRLLAHMDGIGAASARPVAPDGLKTKPLLDFDAGYIQRALDGLPKQGTRSPWLMSMNYLADRRELRSRPVVDEFLRFDDAAAPVLEELPTLLAGPGDTGVEEIVDLGDGRSMCVRIDGPADGPAVIMITGLAFDLTAWPISFVKSLVKEGFRVVRIDNRDEGRSFRATSKAPSARQLLSGDLPEDQYTVEDMSEDVADTMRALGIDRADLIGFSLGGMIAQSLAAHHPELVRRLVSICSTTGDPDVGTTATSTAAMLMLPGAPNRSVYIRGRTIIGRHLAGPGYPIDEAYEAQLAAAHWDRSLNPHGESAAMRRQIGAIRAPGTGQKCSRTSRPPLW
ncbi:alpha/beta fold hydrolase [Kocuria atrinae]|uniref:alpha/beta fold hydrolase n=1 Tax=Kocuria atrinae TaxID=592377 RepID=UPI00036D73AB|nr:alpha/beta fold hydrolase [Kocuria atrinae]